MAVWNRGSELVRHVVRLEEGRGLWLGLGPIITVSLGMTSRNRPLEPICLSPDCVVWGVRTKAADSSGSLNWKDTHLG